MIKTKVEILEDLHNQVYGLLVSAEMDLTFMRQDSILIKDVNQEKQILQAIQQQERVISQRKRALSEIRKEIKKLTGKKLSVN